MQAEKIYAYRVHSTMTDNSFWFLSNDIDRIEHNISRISDMITNWQYHSSEDSNADQYLKEIYDYCKNKLIVVTWDDDTYDIEFDDMSGEYLYKDIPIEIVDEWEFRF